MQKCWWTCYRSMLDAHYLFKYAARGVIAFLAFIAICLPDDAIVRSIFHQRTAPRAT